MWEPTLGGTMSKLNYFICDKLFTFRKCWGLKGVGVLATLGLPEIQLEIVWRPFSLIFWIFYILEYSSG